MKQLISLYLLVFTFNSQAKFAAYTFQIPCEKIELKVLSCEESSITNKGDLREAIRKREDIVFLKKGALVKAYPLKREAVKCSDDQKMDLKRYKETDLKESFFVTGAKCAKGLKKLTVFRPNFYCDTPGTPTIFGCYINKLESKKSFEYTEVIPSP